MFVYYFLILLAVILWRTEKEVNSVKFAKILFAIIFVLFAFREYDVGVDTTRYIEQYSSGESYLRSIDYGYASYSSFLSSLGISPRVFLAISSFIMLFPFYLYIKKSGMPRLFSIILYITIGTFAMQLSGLRQSLAVSIILLGIVLAIDLKRKWLRYIVILGAVMLAESFHHTAIIGLLFIPMFIAMEKSFSVQKGWRFVLAILPIVLFFMNDLFAPLVDQLSTTRYEDYEIGSENVNLVAFFLIPYVIFIFIIWLSGKVGLDDKYERIGFLCAILYIVCASASIYMPILSRIENYFSLPMLVLITHLTSKMKPSIKQLLLWTIGIVCILFFFISVDGGILQIDNYHFSIK